MNVIKKLKSALSARVAAVNDFHHDLADLRQRIADTRQTIVDIAKAAPSVEEVTARVKSFCDGVVAKASDQLAGLALLGGNASDHDVTGRVDTGLHSSHGMSTLYGLTALQAWALADEAGFRKRTMAEAQTKANGPRMSAPQKAAERTRLEAELDDLERSEESLLRAAENSGLMIPRRTDASPKWVLAPDSELEV